MSGAIDGARVLIVEDEELISLLLQDMLSELGCEVAGVAASVDDARPLAGAGDYDLAILDVHLGGDSVYPVADAVAAIGRPVVFATGSGRESLPERYADATVLPKPYAMSALETALAKALARH